MKTSLLLSLAMLWPFLGFGQFQQSIDFIGSIDYSYRQVRSTRSGPRISEILEQIVGETGKMNWRLGVNFNQRIKNNFYFKTGLRLASVGYKGPVITDRPAGSLLVQTITDFWFAEIPLAACF
ncbi:MAG: hypothetical protein AAF985_05265 [Bacteroidota bacterium]